MTTTETNGHVEEWVPPGMPMPPCVEWADNPQTGFTVRRRNSGLWVAAKCGVYRDTEAVVQKIKDTIMFWDTGNAGHLMSVRLDLGVARLRYT